MRFRRGVAFNTIVNLVAMPLLAVGQLLLTMVLADGLTVAQFGTWSFLLGFTFLQGYGGVLDLGFGVSALRSLVRSQHGADDDGSPEEIAGALRAVYLRLSAVGAVVLVIVMPLLFTVVDVDFDNSQIVLVVACFVGMLICDMRHAMNMVFLESDSRFPSMRSMDLLSLYLWLAIATISIAAGAGIPVLAALALVQSILVVSISSLVSRSVRRSLGHRRVSIRSTSAQGIWRTAKWIAAQRVSSVVNSQMDRTVLAIVLGVVAVGRYQIPYKIQAFGVMLLGFFPSAIFPFVTKMHAKDRRDSTSWAFHLGTRWTVGVTIPVFLAVIVMAEPLVGLWVGDSYLDTVGSVRLFMVLPIIASFHYIGASMMIAHGRTREQFMLATSMVVVNLFLSLILVHPLGINGVILGTVIGTAAVFVPYVRLESQLFGTSARRWTTEVLLPSLAVAAWTIPALVGAWWFWSKLQSDLVGLFLTVAIVPWGWSGFFLQSQVRRDVSDIISSMRRAPA